MADDQADHSNVSDSDQDEKNSSQTDRFLCLSTTQERSGLVSFVDHGHFSVFYGTIFLSYCLTVIWNN